MAPTIPAKDKQGLMSSSTTKSRRNGHAAAVATATSSVSRQAATAQVVTASTSQMSGEPPSIDWASESVKTLHEYRNAYNIQCLAAFKSQLNQAILTMPGIASQSPTIARKKDKRKVPKEQLALAIRKHFNGQATNEMDVMTDFIYKTRHQDQTFKLRSAPQKPR